MRIVLVFPPWLETYGRFASAAKVGCVTIPLGLCYLAAACKQAGHDVTIMDAQTDMLDVNMCVDQLLGMAPDVVGISSTTPIYHNALSIAKGVKSRSDIPVVMGGVHPSIAREAVLEDSPEVDFAMVGECERSLPHFLEVLGGEGDYADVSGLIYRRGEEILSNPVEFISDLDAIPFPDRSSLPQDLYIRSVPGVGLVRYTDFFSSRGCPFRCIFCSAHTIAGRKIRYRSIPNVIEEIGELVETYNVRHIAIMDENFCLSEERVVEFRDAVKASGLSFTWEGMSHVSTVTRGAMKAMKDSGLVRMSFGIESGNPEILKVIRKKTTLDQVRLAYEMAAEVGVERRGSAIIGHPYETKKTAMDTINFLVGLKECQQVYLNIATPYPGTEMWECAVSGRGGMKLLTKDFSKYQRYGRPVIEVNDLTADDLVRLQRWGLIKFYIQPRRFYYNLKRAGFKAGFRNALAFAKSIVKG